MSFAQPLPVIKHFSCAALEIPSFHTEWITNTTSSKNSICFVTKSNGLLWLAPICIEIIAVEIKFYLWNCMQNVNFTFLAKLFCVFIRTNRSTMEINLVRFIFISIMSFNSFFVFKLKNIGCNLVFFRMNN